MWRARLSHLVKGVYIQYDNQAHSSGVRAYLAKNGPILQKLNPTLPFRYTNGKPIMDDEPVDLSKGKYTDSPHLVVQYDREQKVVPLAGLSEGEVESKLAALALEGLTLTTPPSFNTIDILHAYHPPLPPFRPKLGPGWQYSEI